MTPVRLRPEVRIPWWAAVGLYVGSYVAWAGMRGWDFRPTPFWVLVAIVLGALIAARSWLSRPDDDAHDDDPTPGSGS